MEEKNYTKELAESANINEPKYIDGLVEGLNAAFYIAQEEGVDLHNFPKFSELQNFALTRLKNL